MKRIWHITLPTIRPTISILLILAIGGILSTGFEQQLLMGNNAILNYSDVLDTYSYRYGLAKGMYSYGTAVGLFKSIVSFILVLSANKITARLNDLLCIKAIWLLNDVVVPTRMRVLSNNCWMSPNRSHCCARLQSR